MALLFQLTQRVVQGFHALWTRYPNKRNRKDAEKAFNQVVKTPELETEIHTALDWQIPEWESMGWYTPPYLGTYLRNERWTDAPLKPKPKTISPALVLKPQTTMVEQQLDARNRIRSLVAAGISEEDAKDHVFRELGWRK